MNLRKRIIASAAAILTVFSMSAATASASYSWEIGNNYCEAKSTKSGVYVSNASLIYNASVSIYGEYSASGSLNGYVGNNTTELTLSPNVNRLIRQYIKEWYYTYAHIYFNNPSGSYNAACGQWAPDTNANYPYLN